VTLPLDYTRWRLSHTQTI